MANTRERKVPALVDKPMDFCPGCGHGIVSRLIMECLEELEQLDNIIFPIGVGCSSNLGAGLECDRLHCCHGRAGAVATGMKRVNPDTLIVSYQGDGDAYNIGIAETFNAAYRGENITVIVINNTNFGMTGGQMAPTTLPGQVTQTTPFGRNVETAGYPIRICEMMATLSGTALAQRVAIDSVPHIREAKKAIRKAFENEKEKRGLSIIEVLSTCPTNWGMSPTESMQFVKDKMIPYYPLGVYKDVTAEEGAKA